MKMQTGKLLWLLILGAPLCAYGQAAKSIAIENVEPELASGNRPGRIMLGVGPSDAFRSSLPELTNERNWKLYYRASSIPVLRAITSAKVDEETIELEFDPFSPDLPDFSTIKKGELTAVFTPPNGPPSYGRNSPVTGSTLSWLPQLTKDKKSADVDITGSLQTAVSAKPQYFWSVKAGYPVALFHRFGTLAPTFTGQASQEENADPDSMKASAIYRKVVSWPNTRQGLIVEGDLFGYEFERKAKDEAVLVNGSAVKRKYQQKNTDLLWSETLHYVTGLRRANVTLSAGGEFGRALSRSVRKTGTTNDSDLKIRRAKLDIDLYKTVFSSKSDKPRFILDGHYTLRLPFTQEPFKQAYVNDGNEFLTSKPRHYANLNATFPITDGIAITVQYKHGSLPPTFEFLDNQATLGFEVFLKHH